MPKNLNNVDMGKWLSNFTKSIASTAINVSSEIMPNVSSLTRDTVDAGRELRDFINENKSSFTSSESTMDKTSIAKKVQESFKEVARDLRTGDFIHSETVMDDFEDDFDVDLDMDLGSDEYDEDGNPDPSTTITNDAKLGATATLRGAAITSNAIHQMAKDIRASNAKITNAAMKGLINSNMILSSQQTTELRSINAKLDVANAYLKALVTFNKESALVFHQEMLRHAERSEEASAMLLKFFTGDKKKYKDDPVASILGAGFNMSEYKKILKSNYDNSFLINNFSTAISLFQMMNDMKSMGDGGPGILGRMLGIGMKKALPKKLARSMRGFDDMLPKYLNHVLTNLGDRADDGTFLGYIGDLFGIKARANKKAYAGAYKKSAIPWDGTSKRALEEVIPYYLSRILQEQEKTNGKQRTTRLVYDYDKGIFVSEREAIKNADEMFQTKKRAAFSDFVTYQKEINEKYNVSSNTFNKITKEVDKIIVDATLSDSPMSINDAIREVQKIYRKYNVPLDPYDMRRVLMAASGGISSYRQSLNDMDSFFANDITMSSYRQALSGKRTKGRLEGNSYIYDAKKSYITDTLATMKEDEKRRKEKEKQAKFDASMQQKMSEAITDVSKRLSIAKRIGDSDAIKKLQGEIKSLQAKYANVDNISAGAFETFHNALFNIAVNSTFEGNEVFSEYSGFRDNISDAIETLKTSKSNQFWDNVKRERNRTLKSDEKLDDDISDIISKLFGIGFGPGDEKQSAAENLRHQRVMNQIDESNAKKQASENSRMMKNLLLGIEDRLFGLVTPADLVRDFSDNTSLFFTDLKNRLGLYSDDIKDEFGGKKAFKNMAKFGSLGFITGMLTPAGPIGGAIIGTGIGILKSSRTFNKFMFGERYVDEEGKLKIKTGVAEQWKNTIQTHLFKNLKTYGSMFAEDTKAYWHMAMDDTITEFLGDPNDKRRGGFNILFKIAKKMTQGLLHPVKNFNNAMNKFASTILDAGTMAIYSMGGMAARLGINLLKAPLKIGSFAKRVIKRGKWGMVKDAVMGGATNALRRIQYIGSNAKKLPEFLFTKKKASDVFEKYSDFRRRKGARRNASDYERIDYEAKTDRIAGIEGWKSRKKDQLKKLRYERMMNRYRREDNNAYRELSDEEYQERMSNIKSNVQNMSKEDYEAFKRVNGREDLQQFIINPRAFLKMKESEDKKAAEEAQEAERLQNEEDRSRYIATILAGIYSKVTGEDPKIPDNIRMSGPVIDTSEGSSNGFDRQNTTEFFGTMTAAISKMNDKDLERLKNALLQHASDYIQRTTELDLTNTALNDLGQVYLDTVGEISRRNKNSNPSVNTGNGIGYGVMDQSTVMVNLMASLVNWVSRGNIKADPFNFKFRLLSKEKINSGISDSESEIQEYVSDRLREHQEWIDIRSGAKSTDSSDIAWKLPNKKDKVTVNGESGKKDEESGLLDKILDLFGSGTTRNLASSAVNFLKAGGAKAIGGSALKIGSVGAGVLGAIGLADALGLNPGVSTPFSELMGTTDADGNRTIYVDENGNQVPANTPGAKAVKIHNDDVAEQVIKLSPAYFKNAVGKMWKKGGGLLAEGASDSLSMTGKTLGQRVGGFAKRGVDALGNRIKSPFVNAAEKVSSTFTKGKNIFSKIAPKTASKVDDAAKAVTNVAGKAKTSIATNASKLFNNVISLIDDAVKKLASCKPLAKMIGDGSTGMSKFITQVSKFVTSLKGIGGDKISKFAAKLTTLWDDVIKTGVKDAISVIALPLKVATVAWDITTGALDAANLFKVAEDDVDPIMRVVSAAIKSCVNFIPGGAAVFALVAEIVASFLGYDLRHEFANIMYNALYGITSAIGLTKGENLLDQKQKEFEQELEAYNAKNGTNLDIDAYNDMMNKTTGRKIIDGVKSFFKGPTVSNTTSKNSNAPSYAASNSNATVTKTSLTPSYAAASSVGYGGIMNDPKYAGMKFGSGTFRTNGCGPAVASDITGKSPSYMARTMHTTRGGTSTSDVASAISSNGKSVRKSDSISSRPGAKSAVLGYSVGYGRANFTKAGHWISTTGLGNGKVLVNDPMRGKSIQNVDDLNSGSNRVNTVLAAGYGEPGTNTSKTLQALANAGYTIKNNSVFYSQKDSRWSNGSFAGGTIGQYGCTPTALAMGISSLTGQAVTPDITAKATDMGGGLSKDSIRSFSSKYGVTATFIPGEESKYGATLPRDQYTSQIMSYLGKGVPVWLYGNANGDNSVCSYGGTSTKYHAVLATGLDKDGKIMINNPAADANHRATTTHFDQNMINNLRYGMALSTADGNGIVGSYGDLAGSAVAAASGVSGDTSTSTTGNATDTQTQNSGTQSLWDKIQNGLSKVSSAFSSIGFTLLGNYLSGKTGSDLYSGIDANTLIPKEDATISTTDPANTTPVEGADTTKTSGTANTYDLLDSHGNKQVNFFNRIAKPIVASSKTSGVLPSISMAQAVWESGWGNDISKSNNLFGIMKSGGGKKYYASWDESIQDYANMMNRDTYGYYAPIKASKNYKEAVMQKAAWSHYCADPVDYGDKLSQVIGNYGLYKYDTPEGAEAALSGKTFEEIAAKTPVGYGLQDMMTRKDRESELSEEDSKKRGRQSVGFGSGDVGSKIDTTNNLLSAILNEVKNGGVGFGSSETTKQIPKSEGPSKSTKRKQAASDLNALSNGGKANYSATSTHLRSIHEQIATGYRRSV